jgi:hypothetical protein
VAILKQRILHKHLPSSFESLRIPSPVGLDTIRDEATRQRLTQQCTQLFERTKSEMMMLYLQVAEARAEEYRSKFTTNLDNYEANQYSNIAHSKLTPIMVDILNRRFRHINEYMSKLYKLKLRFFAKAPTAKN